MRNSSLDADPARGHHMKKYLGITGEYFTAIAPEPTDDELVAIRERLRRLYERPERLCRPELEEDGDNPWF
jgi:hypothetical protein